MKKILIAGLLLFIFAACEEPREIEEITSYNPVEVERYTAFDDLPLPERNRVHFTDDSRELIDVDWSATEADYDKTTTGTYTLEGEWDVDEPGNLDGFTPEIEVKVTPASAAETIGQQASLSTFATLLEMSGEDFSASDHTYFAPTDDAFTTLFNVFNTDEDAFKDTVDAEAFIKSHMLEGTWDKAALSDTDEPLEAKSGATLAFTEVNGDLRIDGTAGFEPFEGEAADGHVHIIDAVLLSDAVTDALGDEAIDPEVLDAFIDELIESGVFTHIITGGEVTAFFPSETAFTEFLDEEGMSAEEFLEMDVAQDVLLYHIVPDAYLADTLYLNAPKTLPTFTDEELSIEVIDDALHVNDARVLYSDELDDIGLLHTIDEVLIPPHVDDFD